MGRHNAFARTIKVTKQAIMQQERQAIVHRCINTLFQASAVALNEEFGFGSDRIARFKEAMERVVVEYGALMSGADVDYADDKLEEAYNRILKGA